MAYYRRRRYGRKKVAPKRKTTTRRKVARKTVIKSIVKQEIARNTENKCRQFIKTDQNLYGAGASAANLDVNNVLYLSPNSLSLDIYQGVSQGDRVGNKIKIKKLNFKGTLVPLPPGTDYPELRPLQIKMFLFYDRTEPQSIPTPNVNSDFFQFNGTSIGIADDLTSMWMPVNTDKYRVLATRMFKLGWSSAINFGSGVNGYRNYSNNDFNLNCNFSIDLTKHLVKEITYRDNNADPTTRGLYCMFVITNAAGQPIGSGQPASLRYMLDCEYEDA